MKGGCGGGGGGGRRGASGLGEAGAGAGGGDCRRLGWGFSECVGGMGRGKDHCVESVRWVEGGVVERMLVGVERGRLATL